MARSQSLEYQTFAHTESSRPEDKTTIEQSIVDLLSGGMHEFDALMIQASMFSDPFVARGFAQSQAAIDGVRRCIDRWLAL